MLQTILHSLARLSCRSPWLVLGVGTVLAVLSVVYASLELELNADLDDLIAPTRPFMAEYRRLLDEFGDLEYIFVIVAGDDVERREQAVNFLAQRLEPLDGVPELYYAIEPHDQLRIATRAIDEDELRELAQAARAFAALDHGAGVAIDRAAEQLEAAIRATDEQLQEELAASAIFLMETMTGEPFPMPQREYLVSESGELHFIQIQPVRDFGTLAVIREPLQQIRGVLDEGRAAFPELEIGITGKPVLQADEMMTSDRDMTRAAILAVVLVTILFMIVIGGIWHPALAVAALMFGIAWTFGLTTLIVGQLNLLSIVFTLVLVGVGIDFGVHLISRYKEERGRARNPSPDLSPRQGEGPEAGSIEQAVATALTTAGRANVIGALTSSIAFFMAIFTEFQGLRELGFIAGMGLLLCLAAMLLVLPSLLVIFDRMREHRGSLPPSLPERTSFQRSAWNTLMTWPRAFVLVMLGLTAVLAPQLRHLSFEQNLLELQAEGLESVQWEQRIMEDSAETWYGAVIVETKQEVLDVTARAEPLEPIARVGSIFDVIEPPSETRDALRARLHAFVDADLDAAERQPEWGAADLAPVVERLGLIATGARMQNLPEAEFLARLHADVRALADELRDPETEQNARDRTERQWRQAADAISIMLAGDVMELREAMPHAVRNQFISRQGNFLVALYPVEDVWEFEHMSEFVAAMREVDPDATGVPITQYESLIEMRRAFINAALLAFMAVFVLLWLDLRLLGDALLAIVPLLLGLVWLLELMSLFGVQFNPANFFAVPILIGIGVDSGIHLMHRYREQNRAGVTDGPDPAHRRSFGSTRRAVFMTSATSMIGFGCLATASHRGLQSLGFVMVLGAFSLMIASLFVLPALLAWLDQRRKTA